MVNSKTWKLALKSRDRRHLAADRYECKTSKRFFKMKYWKPLIKKLFLAKRRKINELPYELLYVFVMMVAHLKKQPNTITASKNTDKLRRISIAYGSG